MFNSILLPVDLAEGGGWEKSVATAKDLLADGGALHVLTVLPDFGVGVVGGFFDADFTEKARSKLGGELRDFVSGNFTDGEKVKAHIGSGSIHQEIQRAADELGVECIVMRAHKPDASDWILGSNATKVASHAKQSVIILRG